MEETMDRSQESNFHFFNPEENLIILKVITNLRNIDYNLLYKLIDWLINWLINKANLREVKMID